MTRFDLDFLGFVHALGHKARDGCVFECVLAMVLFGLLVVRWFVDVFLFVCCLIAGVCCLMCVVVNLALFGHWTGYGNGYKEFGEPCPKKDKFPKTPCQLLCENLPEW